MEEFEKRNILDMNFENIEPTYTLAETLNKLAVTKFRLSTLVKKEVIIQSPILAPDAEPRYTKRSVQHYADTVAAHIKVKDIALELNVQRATVFNLMQSLNIPFELDTRHYSHPTAIINLSAKEQLCKAILDSREATPYTMNSKTHFSYMKEYALYQPFIDAENNTRRLIIKKSRTSKSWGFYEQEQFIPLLDAITKKQYKPTYQLTHVQAAQSQPYLQFSLKSYDMAALAFLDALYQTSGISNMYVSLENDGILQIFTRPCIIDLTKHSLDIKLIQNGLIKEGNLVKVEGDKLHILANYKTTSFKLHQTTLDQIKALSERYDVSTSDILEKAVVLLMAQANIESTR